MWETYEKRNRELDAQETEAGQEKFQPVFFQRRYTIFRLPHLASRIVDFDDPRVQMPTGSIVHLLDDIVVPYDQRSDLPRFELHPILMRESFRKFILHTRELNLNGPIQRADKYILKWAGLPSILMRFRSRNGGSFKYPMTKLDLPTRLQTLTIVNHNPLTRIRMFGRLQYYRKVELILASVFNDVCELAKLQPEKTQYIFLPWGTDFYDRQLFLRSRKVLSFSTIKRPESFQYILMMHLLNYVHEEGETSIFSKIPDDVRSKINLILYLNGKYVIFNLATIKAMNEKNIAYIRFCNLLNMFSITGRVSDTTTPAERELLDKHFNIPATVAEPEDGLPDDTPDAARDEERQQEYEAKKKMVHPTDVPTQIETVVPAAVGTIGSSVDEKITDLKDAARGTHIPIGGAHSVPHTQLSEGADVEDTDIDIPDFPDLPDLDLPDIGLDLVAGVSPAAADRAASIVEKAKIDAARTPDEKKEGFLAHVARKIADLTGAKKAAYGIAGDVPEITTDSQTQIRVEDTTETYTKDYTVQQDKAAEEYIDSLETLTPKQMERYKAISKVYKNLTINDEPLEKILKKEYSVELDKAALGDNVVGSHPADPSVRFSSLREYEKSYMHKSYQKQLVSTLTGFRRAGIFLIGLKTEHKRTPISNDMYYACSYIDVRGKKSTVTLRVPVVDEEGRILVDGVYKVLKKQRVDLPIVKISPTEVSLSSNYNKYRVMRNTAKAHDFFSYVDGLVNNSAKSEAEVVYGSCEINLPISRDYVEIATRYKSIKYTTQDKGNAVALYFDYNNRFANANRSLQEETKFYDAEKQFGVWFGKFGPNDLFIDTENQVHCVYKLKDEEVDFAYPTLPELLKQSLRPEESYDKMLTEWTVMKILDATLPVIFILAYRFGLRKVLDKIGLKYTITERRSKVILGQSATEGFKTKYPISVLVNEKKSVVVGFSFNEPNREFLATKWHTTLFLLKQPKKISLKNLGAELKALAGPIAKVLKIKDPSQLNISITETHGEDPVAYTKGTGHPTEVLQLPGLESISGKPVVVSSYIPKPLTDAAIVPLIRETIERFKEEYDVDLSYIKFKLSDHPVNHDGRHATSIKDEEFGGSWAKNIGAVYLNRHFEKPVKFYHDGQMSKELYLNTLRVVIAHELAHVMYQRHADDKFKQKIKSLAVQSKFTSSYLQHIGTDHPKYEEEFFCEYVASKISSRVQAGLASFGAGSDIVAVGGSTLEPSEWIKSPTKEGEPGVEWIAPVDGYHKPNREHDKALTVLADCCYSAAKNAKTLYTTRDEVMKSLVRNLTSYGDDIKLWTQKDYEAAARKYHFADTDSELKRYVFPSRRSHTCFCFAGTAWKQANELGHWDVEFANDPYYACIRDNFVGFNVMHVELMGDILMSNPDPTLRSEEFIKMWVCWTVTHERAHAATPMTTWRKAYAQKDFSITEAICDTAAADACQKLLKKMGYEPMSCPSTFKEKLQEFARQFQYIWYDIKKFLGMEDIDTEDPNAVRYVPQPNDIAIKFADRTIWFNRYPLKQSLIASGLDAFDLTKYELAQFESKEVYYQLLMDIGKSINYLKGVDSFFDLFVDQMTYNVLRSMHEPTTAAGLLVRATELLVTADHRPPSANANHRIRGYEQFNAIIYNELSRQVANYQAARGRGNSFSLPPDAIYLRIVTNPALVTVTSANPLQDIKESAELTHAGVGGRTEESFVINDRRYTKDDIGVMAPDTTDNGNVGMSAMLSLNPGILNTEGFTKPPEKLEPSNVLSAPVLTFPFATNDD